MKDDIQNSLGKIVTINIDYPIGSKLAENRIYLANYGHACGFKAYLLGVFEPVKKYEGRLIGILEREQNDEPILIVSPHLYTSEQIIALTEFQEKQYAHGPLLVYDKSYWPEDFNLDMPIVQKAIKISLEHGSCSASVISPQLGKGHGYASRLADWLKDNNIISGDKK